MFGNNTNNSNSSINVNTKLYTSYSDDSLLILSAWNTNLSIKLSPAKGKNDAGLTIYTTEMNENVTASVTPETDQILLDSIEEKILPALKEKKSASVAIVTGVGDKRKIVNITTENGVVVLKILYGGVINLDCTSSQCATISHTFNNRTYANNYSVENAGELIEVPTDFLAFVAKLKELKYVDGAISHGITYNNTIKNAYASKANTQQQTQQDTYQAPIINVDSSDDNFLPFN